MINCTVCHVPYSQEGLLEHMEFSHPRRHFINKNAEKLKRFILPTPIYYCAECDITFHTAEHLSIHIRDGDCEEDDDSDCERDDDWSDDSVSRQTLRKLSIKKMSDSRKALSEMRRSVLAKSLKRP